MNRSVYGIFSLTCLLLSASSVNGQQKADTSAHSVQMISVEPGVKVEVLDWGGSGRSLVLLTGLPDTAHVFDDFAPKLTAHYHVYGITRRGRGISSAPEPNVANYSASRLGKDVLAAIEALHLNKPVVAGHSIAGEELSYIGSHHPDKVAGLIYIEAGYPYALYDQANGEFELDSIELRNQLRQFINGYATEPVKDYDTVIANLQRVEKEIEAQERETGKLPPTPVSPRMTPDLFAIMEGRESFTTVHTPALVIFADEDPPDPGSGDDPQSRAQAARQAIMKHKKDSQIAAFERQVPSAHVVKVPHGIHYVFRSNEADVLREINAFIAALPAS